jgi:hypothetical protein
MSLILTRRSLILMRTMRRRTGLEVRWVLKEAILTVEIRTTRSVPL